MNKLKRVALNIIAEQLSETEIGSLKVGSMHGRVKVTDVDCTCVYIYVW